MSPLHIVWVLFALINGVTSKASNWDMLCSRLNSLAKVVTGPIQKQPDRFSLLYHSFPSECQLIPPKDVRFMMFPSHDEDDLTFYCPLRHSSSINVVMSPIHNVSDSLPVFLTGFNLAMSITTVFVLLQPNPHLTSPFTHEFQLHLPALKFTLYFDKGTEVATEIECNLYCFDKEITVATLQKNLHTPKLFHKKLFRIGIDNLVYAIVFGSLTTIQLVSGSDCNEWMRSGSLLLMFCSQNIFSVDEISRVHNLSIRSFATFEELYEIVPNLYNAQSLTGIYSSTNYSNTPETVMSGLVFSNFESTSFIYCVLKQASDENKDFSFWTQPFKAELWLVLVLIMTTYCIYSQAGSRDNKMFAAEVCKSVFKFVEVMIGNGEIRNSRFQEPPPVPYAGIKQILIDGYKILDFTHEDHYVSNDLAPLLKLRGIQVSKAFHVSNEISPTWEFLANRLTEKKIRNVDTSDAQRILEIFKSILMLEARFKYDCRVLPEVIDNAPNFWTMYTLNRDWIGLTINRIIEAGLQTMWSTMEKRTLMLARGLKGKVEMTTDDIIGARRVELLMGLVGGTGVILALLCLITEKLLHMVTN